MSLSLILVAAQVLMLSFPFCLNNLYWPFTDPAAFEGTPGEQLARFREVRDQIDERIQVWLRDDLGR